MTPLLPGAVRIGPGGLGDQDFKLLHNWGKVGSILTFRDHEGYQMGFEPKTAIVTGSDSGIGRAIAVALAKAGMDVGITWHSDEQGAAETAEEVRSHGRTAVVARLDTTDLPGCGDVVVSLAEKLGGLDVFVNN